MRRQIIFAALLFSGLCILEACTDSSKNKLAKEKEDFPAFDIEVARLGIQEANLEFIDLFNKSDSVGLANMFTIDGESMEPNEPVFYGRSKIQSHYAQVMKGGANKLELVTIGLWGDANMLAEEGEFTFMDKDGKQLDKGKYIVLWKVEDGTWKLFRDCYNSDLPVQGIKK
ncbi:MAG TPA: nuclear transport factor 2 family protein [Prolixibacteraceae bacterium]|jgi:ketosteroid isomerase-like protein